MNVNFGLFPPLADDGTRGRERKRALARRALAAIDSWARHLHALSAVSAAQG